MEGGLYSTDTRVLFHNTPPGDSYTNSYVIILHETPIRILHETHTRYSDEKHTRDPYTRLLHDSPTRDS